MAGRERAGLYIYLAFLYNIVEQLSTCVFNNHDDVGWCYNNFIANRGISF
jgi:hypothetical protein